MAVLNPILYRHRKLKENISNVLGQLPNFKCGILCGSIASGSPNSNSDIDIDVGEKRNWVLMIELT